jgi:hypothetical protein
MSLWRTDRQLSNPEGQQLSHLFTVLFLNFRGKGYTETSPPQRIRHWIRSTTVASNCHVGELRHDYRYIVTSVRLTVRGIPSGYE